VNDRESRWTPPSAWCPNPELWTSRDIDATEFEVLDLVHGLVRGTQPEVAVETGTYLGDGTRAIASALVANRHGVLHTFETHADKVAAARESCHDLTGWIRFHNRELGDWTPPGPVDFCFFDSSFGARRVEFYALLPFMHARTVVVFHDTAPHLSMRPLLDDMPLTLLDLHTPRGVTVGQLRRQMEETS
jgi:predicted O-methyltransferase YrrM